MKYILFCIIILFNLIRPLTPLIAQNWIAANRFSIQAGAQINGHSTLVLPDGGQLMAGNFQNTITFGGTTLNAPSPSLQSGFLVKLDASLQPVWAKVIPHLTYDLHMDAAGNILIAGSVSSKLTATDSLACLSKLDPSGNPLAYFQAAGSATSWAKVLRTDPQGNVYLAGERFSSGTAVFGNFSFSPTNSRECFLLQLNPALNQVNWATYTGHSANLDNIYDLELDTTNGFIYTSGNYSQNYSPPIIGCGCYNGDFYVEKHNTNTGASVWKKIFSGGSGDITKQFIRLSADGQQLSVAACFKKTTQFEPAILLTANTNLDYHLYLAEMNASDGVVQWAKKLSSTGDAYLWQVAKQDNDIWLYGYLRNQTTIGSVVLNPSGYDVFLARTLTDGTVQEAEKLNGTGPDFGYGLDVRNDVLAVTGNSMSSTMTIGSFSLSGTTSSVFVARKGEDVVAPPIAGFTAGNTSGCGPLEVTFTNTSLQNPASFHWEFPGGTPASSIDMSPTVEYQSSGQYTVTLIATNAGGSDTLTQQQVVTILPEPAAAFSAALSGLQMTLLNQSANANAWLWDFGDGQTSTLQNPVHAYENCGAYQVSLIAGNVCGSDTLVQEVSVISFPTAIFDFQVDGLELILQNQSTNGDSWLWNFGDGQTSTLQNPPPHVYADTGVYIVTLTVTNQCGVSIFQEDVEVSQMSSTVSDPETATKVLIRPNPNNGIFTLEWQTDTGKQAQVRLFSTSGTLLREWQLTEPSTVLHTLELPAGIYLLQLSSGKRAVWKKVVIAKGK